MIGLICRTGIIHMRFNFVVFGEVYSKALIKNNGL